MVNQLSLDEKKLLIASGRALDFVDDPNPLVREAVAKLGVAVDQLVNDPNVLVRLALARQGYALDILVNDHDPRVRMAVESFNRHNTM